MKLILIALAPVFLIAFYIYLRDKYEREPIGQLLLAFFVGCLVPVPVLAVGGVLNIIGFPTLPGWKAFYEAFVVAAFNEELFKFLFLFILIWFNKNFNEKFDGIVYAVYISLGFAAIENIMYVLNYGETAGYTRAILSVPAHALFGVTMGFYFGLARFYPDQRKQLLIKSLIYPIILHGIFDFILMLGNLRLMALFIPFVVFLYIDGFRKIKNLSGRSIYKADSLNQ